MSVTAVGKCGPSSHLEPASQQATQPVLKPASQSFLKGLWFDRIPRGEENEGRLGLAAVSPQTVGEDTLQLHHADGKLIDE